MNEFIPFDKLSKKKKSEANKKLRRTWGSLKPVTRKPPKPKAYDRNKEKASRQQQKDKGDVE